MSSDKIHLNGKYRESSHLSFDNPEVGKKADWWDEMCKAHGEENFWKKPTKLKKEQEQEKEDDK